MSLLRRGERQAVPDGRVDAPRAPELEELRDAATHELKIVANEAAEVHAGDRDVAADEPLDARVLPGAPREPDRDDRPQGPQQRQRPGEHLAAHRIEDGV